MGNVTKNESVESTKKISWEEQTRRFDLLAAAFFPNKKEQYLKDAEKYEKKSTEKEEEKKPVSIDDVKTILSKDTSSELNEFIVQMATMVRDGQLDQGACKSQISQLTNSMKEYAEKKLPSVVEVITDKEEVPFDEDAPKNPKKGKKSEIIDAEFREVNPEDKKKETKEKKQEKKDKKPQEALKNFNSTEEANAALKEQEKKEKQILENIDVLPPISTKQLQFSNAEKPIENEKVRNYLFTEFTTALRGEPFDIVQSDSGLFHLKFNGATYFIDNNSILRDRAQLIVNTVVFDPYYGTRTIPEFVSVKMRPDIVYAWTHDPQLRATGITDPVTIQELQRDRKLPYELIRQIDFSFGGLPTSIKDEPVLVNNLLMLLNHKEMKEIPGVKYRFAKYRNNNKFTLVSDDLVKAPMAMFNSSISRVADPGLTIAFNNPNNIKIMYNGIKKRFSLTGKVVEEESSEDKED